MKALETSARPKQRQLVASRITFVAETRGALSLARRYSAKQNCRTRITKLLVDAGVIVDTCLSSSAIKAGLKADEVT